MGKVAHLLRAVAKWGVVTIIASLIGVAVEHEVNDLIWAGHHRQLPSYVTISDGRVESPDSSAT
jgi:hypothetical protein